MATREVPVCLRCGNRDIRTQTLRDGLVPGFGEMADIWVCDRCGHVGVPLRMDADEAPEVGVPRWDEDPVPPRARTLRFEKG